MTVVDRCPQNQTEASKAATRLECPTDKYGNNQYMCLPNWQKTSLVEFCYNGLMGLYDKGMKFKLENIT